MNLEKQKANREEEPWKGPTGVLFFLNVLFYVFAYGFSVLLKFEGNPVYIDIFSMPSTSVVVFGLSFLTLSDGWFWQIITNIFLHANLAHLFGNMLFLFIYGFALEERGFSDNEIYLGFILTGILSSLVSMFFLPYTSFSLGASGAIFGLLGMIIAWAKVHRSDIWKRQVLLGILLFVFSSAQPNVNIFAHLFGLIFGYLIYFTPLFNKSLSVPQ